MTAIADMKTRIIGEMNRDDMGSGGEAEQRLIDAYTQTINCYADEMFWFNRTSGTKATVASTATIALPTGMRIAIDISYQQVPLRKARLEEIQYLTQTGQPTMWAENDGAIQLYPIPNAIYTLTLYGIADLGVPASSNEWVVEALDLIVADTKLRLYRGSFRDVEGAAMAREERDEALTKLRRETRKRGITGLTSDLPTQTGFNINTG